MASSVHHVYVWHKDKENAEYVSKYLQEYIPECKYVYAQDLKEGINDKHGLVVALLFKASRLDSDLETFFRDFNEHLENIYGEKDEEKNKEILKEIGLVIVKQNKDHTSWNEEQVPDCFKFKVSLDSKLNHSESYKQLRITIIDTLNIEVQGSLLQTHEKKPLVSEQDDGNRKCHGSCTLRCFLLVVLMALIILLGVPLFFISIPAYCYVVIEECMKRSRQNYP